MRTKKGFDLLDHRVGKANLALEVSPKLRED
jgi:hypothetical protein